MHYMALPPEVKASAAARDRSRLQSLATIAVFDVGGPLVIYSLLRSQGMSAVTSLVLSGVFPAFGVAIKFIRDRRVDVIGVLVLAGIAVGTLLGLLSGNARLVLVEGSVPTAVFGVVCLGSLWSGRPLIYRFSIEFIGAGTPRGREFESMWQYREFRHLFRVMTVVWGIAFLAEAAARVVIVELTSTGTAFAISKVMPYVVTGMLVAWMIAYGNWARRRGERAGVVQAAPARTTPAQKAPATQTAPATQLAEEAEANAEPPRQ
jgi:hypothetical protein